MLNNKTIAVIIPAYNEESQIGNVLQLLPDFIDRVVVIDDGSTDNTSQAVKNFIEQHQQQNAGLLVKDSFTSTSSKNPFSKPEQVIIEQLKKQEDAIQPFQVLNSDALRDRVILLRHPKNKGVGAAVSTGYTWCRRYGIDCMVKVDGDGQMDPHEIEEICKPVVNEGVDYVKGNRLMHKSSWYVIPRIRFLGNSVLSILTKIASGYWRISDTQTAFTAISLEALFKLDLSKIYPSYGYPNDVLVKLNTTGCTIKEVEIKPIYDVGERSKMKIFKVIPRISWLLLKSFFKRLWVKYLFRDFHPVFLLYHLSFLLFIASIPYAYRIIFLTITEIRKVSDATILAFMFLVISAFQAILFAMWMDIQNNDRLHK